MSVIQWDCVQKVLLVQKKRMEGIMPEGMAASGFGKPVDDLAESDVVPVPVKHFHRSFSEPNRTLSLKRDVKHYYIIQKEGSI